MHDGSVMSDSFVTLWTATHQAPLSMGFSRLMNTEVGCHALLQGIFLTQGSNPCLLHLLCWQEILYHCTTWAERVTKQSYQLLMSELF